MITNFLVVRKAVRKFFQKYQTVFEILFKFIITYMAYDQITTSLNFSETLTKSVLKLGVGVLGAFVPEIVTILILGLVALYEVYSAAPILALLVLVLFIVMYCFAARFSGKYAYAIIAIPILFKFNLQYMIPILLGLTASPLAMFPAACGVCFYYILKVIVSAVSISELENLDEALALYIKVIDDIISNKDMIYTIAIFAAVIIIMWLIRRLQFSFAFELTILSGMCICLIGHFLVYLKLDVPIEGVVVGTVLSTLIVCFVQFFRLVLDYSGVQSVQFEDDDYYYYVKAIPKVDSEVPDRFVKKGEKPEKPEKPVKEAVEEKITVAEEKPAGEKVDILGKIKDFFVGIGSGISELLNLAHDNFKKQNEAKEEKVTAEEPQKKVIEKAKPEKNLSKLESLGWDDDEDDDEPISKREVNEKTDE